MSISQYVKTTSSILLVSIFFILSSCTSNNNTNQNEETTDEINLEGKTLEYNYGNTIYQVSFKSSNQLHWKCIKGDELGQEADETYFTHRLNSYSFFISWVEANDIGVSQVINLNENVVNCFLKIDKEVISLSGTIKEL